MILLASLSTAPFQCAKRPDPERAIEEEPGDALYKLAERFREKGDREARITTLRYLVERFPSSRFAPEAKRDLEELGVVMPADDR